MEAARIAPVLPAETKASDVAVLLKRQADDDAGIGLASNRGERLLTHADDIGRLMNLDARPVDAGMSRQLGLDRVRLPDELYYEVVRVCGERIDDTGDFRLWRAIAAHRVYRDANHAQASSTSTCFLPR